MGSLSLYILIALVSIATLTSSVDISPTSADDTSDLLEKANELKSLGKINDALAVYETIIASSPSSYLTYFRRAATYLQLGRNEAALSDFTKVLELKPDFTQALLQRGKLLSREGQFTDAVRDLQSYAHKNPKDTDVSQLLMELKEAQEHVKLAEAALKKNDCENAIQHLSTVLSVATYNVQYRMKRAQCYATRGDAEMASSDYSRAAKLKPDNTEALLQLANLHLSMGEIPSSMSSIRDCLKYDPDHSACKTLFRQLKKLEKNLKTLEQYESNSKWKDIIKMVPSGDGDVLKELDKLNAKAPKIRVLALTCKAYHKLKDSLQTIEWCSKVLNLDENHRDALVFRAEASIKEEDYESAARDYRKAHDNNEGDREILEALHKVQRLLQQSSRKNYYKVLGVKRSATKKEIKKAYRKLAQQWHPDKYQGDLSKDAVLKKMSEINEAYETLSNDDTRERYDNGEDVNDPNGQTTFYQQGSPFGFPFPGGSFGGGQQHFSFKFG
ncbi:hypothetical protein SeMB42_g00592 [Synchytrium endobioticum]|uniref:Tetratricopeptide repeat and J domain-containing co-chaperone DNJ1 n=1 Tax=Synchytrium endobioticum TaxID=286115 RepID=A0A507DSF0_9FUNG|nr:hypothetical protein SeMB42_g00592 [Synchytrium endobioticum]